MPSDELVSHPLLISGRVIEEVPAKDVRETFTGSSGFGECITNGDGGLTRQSHRYIRGWT